MERHPLPVSFWNGYTKITMEKKRVRFDWAIKYRLRNKENPNKVDTAHFESIYQHVGCHLIKNPDYFMFADFNACAKTAAIKRERALTIILEVQATISQ